MPEQQEQGASPNSNASERSLSPSAPAFGVGDGYDFNSYNGVVQTPDGTVKGMTIKSNQTPLQNRTKQIDSALHTARYNLYNKPLDIKEQEQQTIKKTNERNLSPYTRSFGIGEVSKEMQYGEVDTRQTAKKRAYSAGGLDPLRTFFDKDRERDVAKRYSTIFSGKNKKAAEFFAQVPEKGKERKWGANEKKMFDNYRKMHGTSEKEQEEFYKETKEILRKKSGGVSENQVYDAMYHKALQAEMQEEYNYHASNQGFIDSIVSGATEQLYTTEGLFGLGVGVAVGASTLVPSLAIMAIRATVGRSVFVNTAYRIAGVVARNAGIGAAEGYIIGLGSGMYRESQEQQLDLLTGEREGTPLTRIGQHAGYSAGVGGVIGGSIAAGSIAFVGTRRWLNKGKLPEGVVKGRTLSDIVDSGGYEMHNSKQIGYGEPADTATSLITSPLEPKGGATPKFEDKSLSVEALRRASKEAVQRQAKINAGSLETGGFADTVLPRVREATSTEIAISVDNFIDNRASIAYRQGEIKPDHIVANNTTARTLIVQMPEAGLVQEWRGVSAQQINTDAVPALTKQYLSQYAEAKTPDAKIAALDNLATIDEVSGYMSEVMQPIFKSVLTKEEYTALEEGEFGWFDNPLRDDHLRELLVNRIQSGDNLGELDFTSIANEEKLAEIASVAKEAAKSQLDSTPQALKVQAFSPVTDSSGRLLYGTELLYQDVNSTHWLDYEQNAKLQTQLGERMEGQLYIGSRRHNKTPNSGLVDFETSNERLLALSPDIPLQYLLHPSTPNRIKKAWLIGKQHAAVTIATANSTLVQGLASSEAFHKTLATRTEQAAELEKKFAEKLATKSAISGELAKQISSIEEARNVKFNKLGLAEKQRDDLASKLHFVEGDIEQLTNDIGSARVARADLPRGEKFEINEEIRRSSEYLAKKRQQRSELKKELAVANQTVNAHQREIDVSNKEIEKTKRRASKVSSEEFGLKQQIAKTKEQQTYDEMIASERIWQVNKLGEGGEPLTVLLSDVVSRYEIETITTQTIKNSPDLLLEDKAIMQMITTREIKDGIALSRNRVTVLESDLSVGDLGEISKEYSAQRVKAGEVKEKAKEGEVKEKAVPSTPVEFIEVKDCFNRKVLSDVLQRVSEVMRGNATKLKAATVLDKDMSRTLQDFREYRAEAKNATFFKTKKKDGLPYTADDIQGKELARLKEQVWQYKFKDLKQETKAAKYVVSQDVLGIMQDALLVQNKQNVQPIFKENNIDSAATLYQNKRLMTRIGELTTMIDNGDLTVNSKEVSTYEQPLAMIAHNLVKMVEGHNENLAKYSGSPVVKTKNFVANFHLLDPFKLDKMHPADFVAKLYGKVHDGSGVLIPQGKLDALFRKMVAKSDSAAATTEDNIRAVNFFTMGDYHEFCNEHLAQTPIPQIDLWLNHILNTGAESMTASRYGSYKAGLMPFLADWGIRNGIIVTDTATRNALNSKIGDYFTGEMSGYSAALRALGELPADQDSKYARVKLLLNPHTNVFEMSPVAGKGKKLSSFTDSRLSLRVSYDAAMIEAWNSEMAAGNPLVSRNFKDSSGKRALDITLATTAQLILTNVWLRDLTASPFNQVGGAILANASGATAAKHVINTVRKTVLNSVVHYAGDLTGGRVGGDPFIGNEYALNYAASQARMNSSFNVGSIEHEEQGVAIKRGLLSALKGKPSGKNLQQFQELSAAMKGISAVSNSQLVVEYESTAATFGDYVRQSAKGLQKSTDTTKTPYDVLPRETKVWLGRHMTPDQYDKIYNIVQDNLPEFKTSLGSMYVYPEAFKDKDTELYVTMVKWAMMQTGSSAGTMEMYTYQRGSAAASEYGRSAYFMSGWGLRNLYRKVYDRVWSNPALTVGQKIMRHSAVIAQEVLGNFTYNYLMAHLKALKSGREADASTTKEAFIGGLIDGFLWPLFQTHINLDKDWTDNLSDNAKKNINVIRLLGPLTGLQKKGENFYYHLENMLAGDKGSILRGGTAAMRTFAPAAIDLGIVIAVETSRMLGATGVEKAIQEASKPPNKKRKSGSSRQKANTGGDSSRANTGGGSSRQKAKTGGGSSRQKAKTGGGSNA